MSFCTHMMVNPNMEAAHYGALPTALHSDGTAEDQNQEYGTLASTNIVRYSPSSLALKFNSLRTAFLCLSFNELGSDPKPPVMGTGRAILLLLCGFGRLSMKNDELRDSVPCKMTFFLNHFPYNLPETNLTALDMQHQICMITTYIQARGDWSG